MSLVTQRKTKNRTQVKFISLSPNHYNILLNKFGEIIFSQAIWLYSGSFGSVTILLWNTRNIYLEKKENRKGVHFII